MNAFRDTGRSGDGFKVRSRDRDGDVDNGNVDVDVKAVDADGGDFPGSAHLSIYHFGNQPGEPRMSVGGWAGPGRPDALRAQAAVLTYAAEILDDWLGVPAQPDRVEIALDDQDAWALATFLDNDQPDLPLSIREALRAGIVDFNERTAIAAFNAGPAVSRD